MGGRGGICSCIPTTSNCHGGQQQQIKKKIEEATGDGSTTPTLDAGGEGTVYSDRDTPSDGEPGVVITAIHDIPEASPFLRTGKGGGGGAFRKKFTHKG